MVEKHFRIISELKILLKALDRFFISGVLPLTEENITLKDFSNELNVVKDVILRILSILEVIIPESIKNAYWLRKYAETKFFSLYPNISIIEDIRKQDKPEKSLLLLYDSFINLKGIISDILKSEFISYTSFKNVGDSIKKELRENKYFSPFQRDIDPEIDKIENNNISTIIKNIKDKNIRKYIALFYIYIFRVLKYLQYVDISSHNKITLNNSVILLFLLKTEIILITDFLNKGKKIVNETKLKDLLNIISYQISMETKRVYDQELKNVFKNISPEELRGKLENSKGILTNLFEQIIVQVTKYFKPEINGKDIFESFVTRLHQSLKLRNDIYVFLKILEKLELDLPKTQKREKILRSLNEFLYYFKSSTLKLIRFNDYEFFDKFINEISTIKEYKDNKLLERIKHFKIFLKTCINQIGEREELKGIPIDQKMVEETLKQFL
jgi:hypothetical protein